jgi:hypothetical protein
LPETTAIPPEVANTTTAKAEGVAPTTTTPKEEEVPKSIPKKAEDSTKAVKCTKSKATPPDVAKTTTAPAKEGGAATTTAPELSLDQIVVSFAFLLFVLTILALTFGCIFIVGGGMYTTSMAADWCIRRVIFPRAAVPVQTTRQD